MCQSAVNVDGCTCAANSGVFNELASCCIFVVSVKSSHTQSNQSGQGLGMRLCTTVGVLCLHSSLVSKLPNFALYIELLVFLSVPLFHKAIMFCYQASLVAEGA